MDTLSKYSHDNDLAVALNAIFAMGLVGAGTNNARLAQMLRQLAGYYYKEPDCLFMVRIAQGLVHMGKGTLTLYPYFLDRAIMSRTAVAGLLATLIAFTDAKFCEGYLCFISDAFPLSHLTVILDKYHWMLYYLVPAMYPRFMITLDEDLKSLPVTVRVGQVRYGLTSLVFDRCSIKLDRLLRLSVRQESHGRLQDSKLTHRPYG
jgi:26S proteasome regulatory subunit N1